MLFLQMQSLGGLTPQKWSFPLSISSFSIKETADLFIFTEEILNEKLHFLYSVLLNRCAAKFRNDYCKTSVLNSLS